MKQSANATPKLITKTTRHVLSLCPWCGAGLDASTSVGNANTPVPGDFTVCIMCASPCCYNADLTVRKATDQEVRAGTDAAHYAKYQLFRRSIMGLDRRR